MQPTAAISPPLPVVEDTGLSEAISSNRKLIDRITYLASLASRFEDVDPMMDTLRAETAKWDRAAPLTTEQLSKLQTLEQNLRSYLINKDPVRSFTAESLEEQVRSREGSSKKTYLSLLGVLGPAVLAGGLPFALPLSISQEVRMLIAIPLFFTVLHIGISWLYLSALKNFKQEIRKAFWLICVGVMLFTATFSHYAAIPAFGLEDHPLFEGAGFTWIVSAPFILIFLGLRLYARQIQVKSKLLSTWFVILIIALASVAAVLEALMSPSIEMLYLTIFLIIGGRMLDAFSAMGALLAWKIRSSVATTYARPMTWMFAYLFFSFLASALTGVVFMLGSPGGDSGGSSSTPFFIFMALAGVPVQLMLMWTGFVFKRESSK